MKARCTKLVPCHFEQAIEQSGNPNFKNCIFWKTCWMLFHTVLELLTSFPCLFLDMWRTLSFFSPQGTFNDWWWSRSRCIVTKDQIPFPTNNFSLFDFKLEKVEWRKDKLCSFLSNKQSSLLVWHGIYFLHYCFFKVKTTTNKQDKHNILVVKLKFVAHFQIWEKIWL